MEQKNTFNLQLLFFPGFYESIFENCDTEYYAIKDEIDYLTGGLEITDYEFKEDDIIFDYKQRREDIANLFMFQYKRNCPKFVQEIYNVEIDSPRFYNFRTDELYAYFDLSDSWKTDMKKFMDENKDWLENKIKEDWTSYDGFDSFMSNKLSEWDFYLFEEQDTRYISVMIAYMMLVDNSNIKDTLIEWTLDDVCDTEYISYSDELNKRIHP